MPPNSIYTFETWGSQVLDFLSDVVKDRAFLICNSVGGIVGLEAALLDPEKVRGVMLINVSLRMLHIKKQQWYVRPFVGALQNVLRTTNLGQQFFASVAKLEAVKENGEELQGFAGKRIASGRTRRFPVNGTVQAARRNSFCEHHKAVKEAVGGAATRCVWWSIKLAHPRARRSLVLDTANICGLFDNKDRIFC